MPTFPLPDRASFTQLRNQARELQRAVRARAPEALAEVAEHLPSGRPDDATIAAFPLSSAQLAIARRYGYASWARLKHHLELIERFSRVPAAVEHDPSADPVDAFLRLCCLTYEDDQPARWAEALDVLVAHPEITARSVHAAAAAADITSLRAILAADPATAREEGGPFRWEPLMYLAYARHDPNIAEPAVLDAARLLLVAGADPNAGYLWHSLPTPFTVLTGTFGEGELGPVRQPQHPHSLELARALLEAGADPNDGQTLYNRMFTPGNDHLVLLFEFGLGTGDGGIWQHRMGAALPTPVQMLRGQLRWAITHGLAERVRLLVDHGVDAASPFDDGMTPATVAASSGQLEIVDELVAGGAAAPALEPVDAMVSALLTGDRARVDGMRSSDANLFGAVRDARPALVLFAAALGRPQTVELLVELGFDVNAKGRADRAGDDEWETALHHVAGEGDVELAGTLLNLGADPDLRDARFDATPLGWARYNDQGPLIELLEPLTAADE